MKNEDTKQEKENPCGRPPRYLTIEKFNRFLDNDFKHLNQKVNRQTVILIAILAAVVARLIVG